MARPSGVGVIAALALLAGFNVEAQTRVEFHLLPAISTGPLDPDWSPDGKFLIFAARGDIWKVPADGGVAVALTEGPYYQSEPVFSPDGNRIALTMDIDGNLEIGMVDATGGDIERLTTNPGVDFAPSWSADGNYLYFVSRRVGDLDILRLDPADGKVTPVAAGPGNQYQPAVSPDGQSLAYVAPVEGRIGAGGIWVKSLPDGASGLVHYEESSYRLKPEWSADGRALTYVSDVAGTMDIAVVPFMGGNRVRLTDHEGDEFDPALSPDGTRLAFVSNRTGPTTLYTMSAAGGARGSWIPVRMDSHQPRFPTGRIHGKVLGPDGELLAARVMLRASDSRSYTEDGGFHRLVPATRTHYQHTDGEFEIEVPAGTAVVEAMHGFEFLPARASVNVREGGTVNVELRLKRIADPRSDGWVSGDMHVHDLHEGRYGLDHETFFLQLAADNVNIANALIHMDGSKLMGRWNDLTGEPHPLSNNETLLRYSQEFRGSFGHVALIGVNEFVMPLIGGAANTPYAADVLKLRHMDAAREQGAISGYVHPYNQAVSTPADAGSSDIPVHVALRKGDFYDVVSVASSETDSTAVYYKFLNSGFRLAATGGTDNFSDVWYDPSGGTARTYARVGDSSGRLDFDAFLTAVKSGRTFATNGPLLFLDVEGRQPGDEIRLQSSDASTLRVNADVHSIAPLDKVEIVVNGEVAHRWDVTGNGTSRSFRTTIDLPAGGWIAARAIGPSSRYVGDAFAFAQTSPVYVVRDGLTWIDEDDVRFLLESVNELWRRVEARGTWQTEAQKNAYRDGIERALSVYRQRIGAD